MDVSSILQPYQIGNRNNLDEFHVREYFLHHDGEVISVEDALALFDSSKNVILTVFGKMIPSFAHPEHELLMFKCNDISSYYLDFGTSKDDPDRGLWMVDTVSNRVFKLSDPNEEDDQEYMAGIFSSRAYNHAASDAKGLFVTGQVNDIIIEDPATRQPVRITYLAAICGSSKGIDSIPRVFELKGQLVPRSKNNRSTILKVKIHVTHYRHHIPLKKGGPHYFAVQDTQGLWYRVLSFHASVAAANSTSLAAYTWPNEENQIWRHVAQYCLKDGDTMVPIESLHVCLTHNILTGLLLPPPPAKNSSNSSSHKQPVALSVSVEVDSYSVDRGLSKDDPNRGLWAGNVLLLDWYKLEPGRIDPCYEAVGRASEEKCASFLALYNAVTDKCKQLSSGHYVVKQTIDSLWHDCGGSFSLDFVRHNKQYCEYHINSALHEEKSQAFLKSIRNMREEGDYVPEAPWMISADRPSKISSSNSSSSSNNHGHDHSPAQQQKTTEKKKSKKKKVVVEVSDIEDSSSSDDDSSDRSSSSSRSEDEAPPRVKTKRPAAQLSSEDAQFDDEEAPKKNKKQKICASSDDRALVSSSMSKGSDKTTTHGAVVTNSRDGVKKSSADSSSVSKPKNNLIVLDEEDRSSSSTSSNSAKGVSEVLRTKSSTTTNISGGLVAGTKRKADDGLTSSLQQPAIPISAGGTGRTVKTVFIDNYPSLQRKTNTGGTAASTVSAAPIAKRPPVSAASPPVVQGTAKNDSRSASSAVPIAKSSSTEDLKKGTNNTVAAPSAPKVVVYRSDGLRLEGKSDVRLLGPSGSSLNYNNSSNSNYSASTYNSMPMGMSNNGYRGDANGRVSRINDANLRPLSHVDVMNIIRDNRVPPIPTAPVHSDWRSQQGGGVGGGYSSSGGHSSSSNDGRGGGGQGSQRPYVQDNYYNHHNVNQNYDNRAGYGGRGGAPSHQQQNYHQNNMKNPGHDNRGGGGSGLPAPSHTGSRGTACHTATAAALSSYERGSRPAYQERYPQSASAKGYVTSAPTPNFLAPGNPSAADVYVPYSVHVTAPKAPPQTTVAAQSVTAALPSEMGEGLGLYRTDPLEVREAQIKRGNVCINCDSPGHNHSSCRQKMVKCPECFLHGHLLKYCWFREPEGSSVRSSSGSSSANKTSGVGSSGGEDVSESLEEVFDHPVKSDVDKRNIIRSKSSSGNSQGDSQESVDDTLTDNPGGEGPYHSLSSGGATASMEQGGNYKKHVTISWNPASSVGGYHTPEEAVGYKTRSILKRRKQPQQRSSASSRKSLPDDLLPSWVNEPREEVAAEDVALTEWEPVHPINSALPGLGDSLLLPAVSGDAVMTVSESDLMELFESVKKDAITSPIGGTNGYSEKESESISAESSTTTSADKEIVVASSVDTVIAVGEAMSNVGVTSVKTIEAEVEELPQEGLMEIMTVEEVYLPAVSFSGELSTASPMTETNLEISLPPPVRESDVIQPVSLPADEAGACVGAESQMSLEDGEVREEDQ